MKSYIWDTGPLSLSFTSHEQIKQMMKDCTSQKMTGYVPMIILSEFYYLQWREFGGRLANMRVEGLINSKLIFLTLDKTAMYRTGEMKVKHTELSLADAVLIALSRENNSTILTTETAIPKIKGIKAKKIEY